MKTLRQLTLILLFAFAKTPVYSQSDLDTLAVHEGPVALTVAEFTTLINAKSIPMLVYLRADWCSICKKQSPIIHEVIKEEQGKLHLLIIDTKANPLINDYFEVEGLPMLILYKDGRILWQYLGIIQKKEILEGIKSIR